MLDTLRIKDLEQVRLLADPLKLKLIQAFADGPRTTGDVAKELGENLTRLYRHVDALQQAGLIEVVKEKRKRGAVERTFQAVARRFEVDRRLFVGEEELGEAARELVRAGEEELLEALGREAAESMFLRLRIRATPERLAQLRRALEGWLEDAQSMDEPEAGETTEEAVALVSFYHVRD